ncbi:MAG: HPr family phosphocarrier protein [Egibacteraceae bacterium]
MPASSDPEPTASPIVRLVVLSRSLHARPAAQVTRAAARLQAHVTLTVGDRRADARSVLAVMSLGATADTQVRVEAAGPDAAAAADEIARILAELETDA